jgi:hypothetical protein
MGDLDATLGHHLDQVSVRKPISDVPAHAQLNDVGVESPFCGRSGHGRWASSFSTSGNKIRQSTRCP